MNIRKTKSKLNLILFLIPPACFLVWLIVNKATINSYTECLNDANSDLDTIYPYFCTTSSGKSFNDPEYFLDPNVVPVTHQWKTYIDNNLELQFKYPETLGITVRESQNSEHISLTIESTQKNLDFLITINGSKSPITAWGTKITKLEDSVVAPSHPYQLNNIKGIEAEPPSAEVQKRNTRYIHFFNNGYLISISRVSREQDFQSLAISEQIISSISSIANDN